MRAVAVTIALLLNACATAPVRDHAAEDRKAREDQKAIDLAQKYAADGREALGVGRCGEAWNAFVRAGTWASGAVGYKDTARYREVCGSWTNAAPEPAFETASLTSGTSAALR